MTLLQESLVRGNDLSDLPEPVLGDELVATLDEAVPRSLGELITLAESAEAAAGGNQQPEESEAADRSQEVFALSRGPKTFYEIVVESDVTLEDYRQRTPEEVWSLMEQEAELLRGQRIVEIGATFEGGGVAMIVPPFIHFLRAKGIAADWLVAKPDPEAFEVTKKMHNLQHDVLDPQEQFTDEDKAWHTALGLSNFAGMRELDVFKQATIYIIDDPQLAAMIPEIKKFNPAAKIYYRNHTQTDRDKMAAKGSPQHRIKEYLHKECGLDLVDGYIAHPVEQFVPYGTPNVAFIPPTCDPFEDLNRPLGEAEVQEKLAWIDGQIVKQNRARQEYWRIYNEVNATDVDCHIDDQAPLDKNRVWLTCFARFDLAKGMPISMELQSRIITKLIDRNAPEELIPHTIIAGNGSVDDPDRMRLLNEMLALRQTEYAAIQEYIKVIGLEHDYAAVSALIGASKYSENISTKEGFEHRRTESMLKAVPSISSDAGGLPLQGVDGQGGHVIELDDLDNELDRVAEAVVDGIMYPEKYTELRQQTLEWAKSFSELELGTIANVIRFLRLFNGKADREWKISEMTAAEKAA